MRSLLATACLLLFGCASDGPGPQPTPSPLAAPVWEAPAQVADAGRGYFTGRFFSSGGPRHLLVDGAGNAFLASSYFDTTGASRTALTQAWGNAYRVGQGWGAPVRLSEGTGLVDDGPLGLGLTPDGALFGWAGSQGGGLRGFDTRAGWQPAGTVLSTTGPSRAVAMVTDFRGTPALAYVESELCWLVRHTGVLEPAEGPLDGCSPLGADGAGALAALGNGRVAVRLPDGRWRTGALPYTPGTYPRGSALVGRPGGGFVVAWAEDDLSQLAYAVVAVDATGLVGARRDLAKVARPLQDPLFGEAYDPQPRLAASASGAAVAWRVGSELDVARETSGGWEPVQAVPNAAVVGGMPSQGAKIPFDLALDASGTLLLAWNTSGGLVSAQRAPGGGWSPTALVVATAGGPRLAMNAAGTAFVAWQGEGAKVMAARSLRR